VFMSKFNFNFFLAQAGLEPTTPLFVHFKRHKDGGRRTEHGYNEPFLVNLI
jgi:hypothetical protein